MEPGPVPPHERTWRHPSELGPPPHEPTTTAGRVLIVTSAALGLVMVGVLAVTMTPDQAATPTAVSSTVSAARAELVGLPVTAERPALGVASSASGVATLELRTVVTPVGDDGMAITTLDGVDGPGSRRLARLPDGREVEVVVVSTDEARGLALVALPASVERSGASFEMADEQPDPGDTVVLHGVETTVVPVDELAGLDVDEGTPVLDADGDLVGLCSDAAGGTELVSVVDGAEPADSAPSTTAGD